MESILDTRHSTRATIMIDFQQVYKHFGTQDVLVNASFTIHAGERVGIVGPNGAGKSTLFALIHGDTTPDRGDVALPKKTRLGYLRQQLHAYAYEGSLLDYTANAVAELPAMQAEIEAIESRLAQGSTRENDLKKLGHLQTEFERLGGYEIRTWAESALCGLGFKAAELGNYFSSFSGGWQMRAELARTMIAQPDILLLDEPSNYLDLPAVEWLQRYLRGYKGTILLISHDRYLLQSLTDITLEVANGLVTRYQGGFDYYLRERDTRYEQMHAVKKNQDRRREQIERFVERFRSKNTKATQVQSRIKMLEKLEEIQLPNRIADVSLVRIADPPHCGAEVMRLENIGLTYDWQRWIFRDVELTINRGDKLALIGYNGTGKTTLLRIIAGVLAPSSGKRIPGHKVVIGYQSQEFAETMSPDKTAYHIIRDVKPDLPARDIRGLLGSFGFSGDHADKTCRVLSGGEKIRLAFARLFADPPNFLLLDEPTTHLDLQGRQALEQALRNYKGTVCLVSHDIEFVRHTATHILALPGNERVRRYHGDFDYYCQKRAEHNAAEHVEASDHNGKSKPADDSVRNRKEQRRLRAQKCNEHKKRTAKLNRLIKQLEEEIDSLEQEQVNLLEQLAGQDKQIDFSQVNIRLHEIQNGIQSRTQKWEEAGIKLEELSEA